MLFGAIIRWIEKGFVHELVLLPSYYLAGSEKICKGFLKAWVPSGEQSTCRLGHINLALLFSRSPIEQKPTKGYMWVKTRARG